MNNSFVQYSTEQLRHDLDAARLKLVYATVNSHVDIKGNSCECKSIRRLIARILTEVNSKHRKSTSSPTA